MLYSPVVEEVTPLAQELLDQRQAFLSQLVYQTYNGYVLSQFKKLEQRRAKSLPIKTKHAVHLIRLLLAGITALREHRICVHVGEHRDRLLAIRDEVMTWEEIDAWRLELHRDFDAAFSKTSLPERPDHEAANRWLLRARRSRLT